MFLFFFLVAESNPKGIPSRTGQLVGGLQVWYLLLVAVILKPSCSELRLVQKKHGICTPFLCSKASKYMRVSLRFIESFLSVKLEQANRSGQFLVPPDLGQCPGCAAGIPSFSGEC